MDNVLTYGLSKRPVAVVGCRNLTKSDMILNNYLPRLTGRFSNIMQTCPCNVDPLTPHFYIVKLGCTGVFIFFYFCSKT